MPDGKIKCPACGMEIESIEAGCPRCGNLQEHMRGGIFLPGPRGSVNDFAFLFTKEEYDDLDMKLIKHLEETKIPIVIATLYATDPLSPSEYASLLYNWWGIGKKKVNKGVLILICTAARHVESEVGLGLEKWIGEKETDEALSKMAAPYLKDGRFYEGVKAAYEHLAKMMYEKVPGVKVSS
jgi:uncharacterized protein